MWVPTSWYRAAKVVRSGGLFLSHETVTTVTELLVVLDLGFAQSPLRRAVPATEVQHTLRRRALVCGVAKAILDRQIRGG
jgi:hypothetical protein